MDSLVRKPAGSQELDPSGQDGRGNLTYKFDITVFCKFPEDEAHRLRSLRSHGLL